MSTVGVLSARARVEEKALMAALAEAGIVSALFPPTDQPLPIGLPAEPPVELPFPVPQIVVDRHPNRQIARAVLSTCRAIGVPALSAGIAASGDRLDVASALAAQGLPRPTTILCTSEEAALKAVNATGIPASLLPLDLQTTAIPLLDMDAAEAVLEHRAVLGGTERSLGLIQAGAPAERDISTVMVIDGQAAAVEGKQATISSEALHLAEAAAHALRADVVAVVVASIDGAAVVWDARPVPDYRDMVSLNERSVAQAIANAVALRLQALAMPGIGPESRTPWISITAEGIRGDVAVSA